MGIELLVGTVVVLGLGILVGRRLLSKKVRTYEDVVGEDLNVALVRVEELLKWARALRTDDRAQSVFVLANTVADAIKKLVARIRANPGEWRNVGLALQAINNIVSQVQTLANSLPDLLSQDAEKEIEKTRLSLLEAKAAFTAERASLAQPHLAVLAGDREAQTELLGDGRTTAEVVKDTLQRQDVPPRRQSMSQ